MGIMYRKLVTPHGHQVEIASNTAGHPVVELTVRANKPGHMHQYITELDLENVRRLRQMCDEVLEEQS